MPNVLGGGDVAGPASATDNAVARFDGTTGKLIQNSVVTIADTTGAIAGAQSLTSPAATNLTLGTGTSGAAVTVLSASNNVGIGTTGPLASLHVQKASSNTLGILERITTSSTVLGESVYLRLIDAAAGGTARAEIGFGYKGTTYQPAAIGYVATSSNGNTMGALYLATRDVTTDSAPTERMRIASTGDVSISSTTAGSSGAGALVVAGGLATGAASYFGGAATFTGDVSAQRLEAVDAAANNRAAAFFRTQNNTTYSSSVLDIQGDRTTTNATYNLINAQNAAVTGQFSVRDSGNAVNTNNSYGAISDRKLKENIVDATSKLEKLNQVRIVNFNRIGNEQKQLGVIAQELEQIFPSMIEEAIDRDAEGNDLGTTTKSVKYSVFVPMLIKAIQELTTRLAAVEAK